MALIGYGIDLNEHRGKDNFPGIVEFVKKYTSDDYQAISDSFDGSVTPENTLEWLNSCQLPTA